MKNCTDGVYFTDPMLQAGTVATGWIKSQQIKSSLI